MSDDFGGASGNSAEKVQDQLPSLDELLSVVEGQVSESDEDRYINRFQQKSIAAQEMFEHIKGLEKHYKHKGYWSYFLMFVMFSMIAFQSCLLSMVGLQIWDFSKYEYLLPLLLVQNLAQVVGLAVFVVKALFAKQK